MPRKKKSDRPADVNEIFDTPIKDGLSESCPSIQDMLDIFIKFKCEIQNEVFILTERLDKATTDMVEHEYINEIYENISRLDSSVNLRIDELTNQIDDLRYSERLPESVAPKRQDYKNGLPPLPENPISAPAPQVQQQSNQMSSDQLLDALRNLLSGAASPTPPKVSQKPCPGCHATNHVIAQGARNTKDRQCINRGCGLRFMES